MRHGRAKLARKTLKFFSLNFGIKPPYNVLMDGNFLVAVVKQKVPIHERIGKTLQNEEFNFFVCRSALDELAMLSESGGGSNVELFTQARQFGLDECAIIESDDIPAATNDNETQQILASSYSAAANDIHKLVLSTLNDKNKKGYIVATQDTELSSILRELPKVLLVRLNRGVLILESPSSASRKAGMREERVKQSSGGGTMTEEEKNLVKSLLHKGQKRKSAEQDRNYQQRKKKKASGPNPLSCKKKTNPTSATGENKKRRKRNKSSTLHE
eukprot:CAMPEP_0197833832 /NCGR_PEP_ID=MMETSP1437-20131217/20227_1 /TAXON_ID=49252 ORGANISM="Eucampia antarctica, Strain CCMP1452" /NCGR_SAMPLE_ID=MMETSP1437 /ASSEMBLY_ACC=CAM_ASM_001096 /LENGTH=271 /DNA_ID=CAMNT_0043438107 /DNA_START=39 /DNA_END=854 /DNA_ORIENTATION=+